MHWLYFFSKWERVLYGIFAVLQITPGIVSRMIGLVGVIALIAVTSKIRFGTLIPAAQQNEG
jgi:UPF0716 family protein affecting phage T7 exclusion